VATLFLFLVALLGGVLNAVAGGGSFLTLPALLYVGVTPVSANATSTLAMWPGSIGSALAYRRDMAAVSGQLMRLGGISLLGGLLGGLLLIRTSDVSFMRLLPWLMLLAVVTFTFGGALTSRFTRSSAGPSQTAASSHGAARWTLLLQLAIATYGGYFGGGMGIMMLAVMTVAGMTDIHEMNGLKAVLAMAINGVALVEFIASGAIDWSRGLVMVAGGFGGGFAGGFVARRIPARHVRTFVVAIGWIMTVYFFLRAEAYVP
jgi:uncharacterized membrane protein YfcA